MSFWFKSGFDWGFDDRKLLLFTKQSVYQKTTQQIYVYIFFKYTQMIRNALQQLTQILEDKLK